MNWIAEPQAWIAPATVKMLALSFLLLVGLSLVAGGFGRHIPKGYLYFAISFSVFVEMLNLRIHGREERAREPVRLRSRLTAGFEGEQDATRPSGRWPAGREGAQIGLLRGGEGGLPCSTGGHATLDLSIGWPAAGRPRHVRASDTPCHNRKRVYIHIQHEMVVN